MEDNTINNINRTIDRIGVNIDSIANLPSQYPLEAQGYIKMLANSAELF